MAPRTFLARTQETQGKVVEGQQYSHTISFTKNIHKEPSQLSLAPSLLLMLQVNQGIDKWAPDQDITKGLEKITQQQFVVHLGPSPMDHNLNSLYIDKQRSLSPAITCASVASETWINLGQRPFKDKSYNISNLRISHVPKPDFFVSFYLIYFYIYRVTFILF